MVPNFNGGSKPSGEGPVGARDSPRVADAHAGGVVDSQSILACDADAYSHYQSEVIENRLNRSVSAGTNALSPRYLRYNLFHPSGHHPGRYTDRKVGYRAQSLRGAITTKATVL